MSEGLKSSEFLVTLVPLLAGLAMIIMGTLKANPELINNGVLLVTGGSAGYGISRGLSKFGNSQPAAPEPKDDKAAAKAVADVK